MKKCYFLFVFLIILFSACKQNCKNKDGVQLEKKPREFVKTVDGVDFKMIEVKKIKKTTLGKGCSKERIVTLSAYYIAETEVTQELYKAVTGQSPSHFGEGSDIADGEVQAKRPVEMVNWYEAALFCNKLTEKLLTADECIYTFENVQKDQEKIISADVTWDFSKKGYRLPTEAEFEYAMKGGDVDMVYAGGNYRIGDNPSQYLEPLSRVAWYNDNSDFRTHQVAKKEPNDYGIYDMSGNVMEWCNDYHCKPILKNVERDPQGPDEDIDGAHVCKGGGYGQGGYSMCIVSARVPTAMDARSDDVGFRVVCRL